MSANISKIILVHGAWADGTSWAKVIPLLAKSGLEATAVQLPLTSFEADVAAVRRAIALTEGELVLVGHSYAGAVIGEAGNDPKVARLVYIDAFAPDAGESAGTLFEKFDVAPLGGEIRPDSEGFLKLTQKGVFDLFAQDLDNTEKAVIFATQGPIHGSALGGTLTRAAWRTRPTYYLIGDQDFAIPPAEQAGMASRMKATVAHVDASHVPMLSKPETVARFIAEASA